ncbi:UNVERIFIED_ORG: chromosome segregation ATPase [Arthrobacter sp. UYCu721]
MAPAPKTNAPHLKAQLQATRRKLEANTASSQHQREILRSKLRAQASDIDRLEAENSEQRLSNNLLQSEVARLKRAQRINVQDLAHIAAWLVSLTQAKGVALDPATLEILRRRGWTPTKRQAEAPRL